MEKLSEAFRKRLLGIRAQYPWANWFAEDETGVGYVYEEKPEIKLNAEFWVAADGEGRALMREFGFKSFKNWRDSLVDLNELEGKEMKKEMYKIYKHELKYFIYTPTPEISETVQNELYEKGYDNPSRGGDRRTFCTKDSVIMIYEDGIFCPISKRGWKDIQIILDGYNAGCRKEEDRNNYFELSIPDLFWNFPDYKEPKPEKKERTLKVHGREFSETTVWNALRFYLKRPEDC